MTHTYKIVGMTCGSCETKVRDLLLKVEGVSDVKIDLQKGEAVITLQKHVNTATLQEVLKPYPKYQLSDSQPAPVPVAEEEQRSWFQTYKPVVLIFAYITGITLLLQICSGTFNLIQWMNQFMAGFFLIFSFFKLLNLSGFADSYAMYDIIAKKWKSYGYLYAFLELLLGLAFAIGFSPVLTNSVTLIVMGISIIGVLQSVLDKKKIKCACLGDVFNLPMSTITIIEDAMMIAMSGAMLIFI
jgi:copper chaperone CopZ